ncbi:ABC transporter substrate-binding protein [Paenibacillus sp. FSL H8-0537]|uniref:ABC transporter substrate-binding protein n=1 Tax=Paenibacillus sp. FSL H8-0537 TaxID=2921399 RepID=UPI0031019C6A
MKKLTKPFSTIVFIALLIVVTACSSASNNAANPASTEASAPSASSSEQSTTKTFKHMKGETVIPAHPQRIADISGSSEELVILGHKPVITANTEFDAPTVIPEHLRESLAGVPTAGYYGSGELNLEAIVQSEPDLIITNIRHEKVYEQLSKIAPTIMLTDDMTYIDWRGRFTQIGDILDQKQQVADWLAAYDAKAAKLHDEIVAKTGAETFAVIEANQKTIRIYGTSGYGSLLFNDLKLPYAEGTPIKDWGLEIDIEGLSTINPDHIFFMYTDGSETDLVNSAIWKSKDAVKNGNVYRGSNNDQWNLSFTPLGKDMLLDQIAEMILNKK